MNHFATNLKYLRKSKKLTQQDVEVDLDMGAHRVLDYEKGRSEPNIEMLIRISKYFDVSLEQILMMDLREQKRNAA